MGGGDMSRVSIAVDHWLNRKVVVKVLPQSLAATVAVDRFRREILLAAKLQHPRIVPVPAAGEPQDLPYFVVPFIEGESLRARIEARSTLGGGKWRNRRTSIHPQSRPSRNRRPTDGGSTRCP